MNKPHLVKRYVRAKLIATSILILLASPISEAAAQIAQDNPSQPALVSAAEAPHGTETLNVEWINVAAPSSGVILAAVARPPGSGPFPTIILLHGTHGFAQEYVRLARDLADGGVLAVAACWFRGSSGGGTRFVTPIACPDAPPMPGPSSPEALQTLEVLVQASRTLPGVRIDRIALFGHSRGGGPVFRYILQNDMIRAAILNSSGYPSALPTDIKAPILILHGTADSLDDGGVAVTQIEMARNFEKRLREAGKPVDVVYYDGGRHNDLFTSPTQYQDEVQQMLKFLHRHLAN